MSLKQNIVSLFTLALAIVGFSTFVSAQDTNANPQDSAVKQEKHDRRGIENRDGKFDKGMHGKHGDKMMLRGLDKINLTESQKTQIHQIMESNRTANQPAFEEMRGLMMKKRDGTITTEEQSRLDTLRTQFKATARQTHNSILAILTAEQRAQLEQMNVERKQKMEERRQLKQNNQNQTQTERKVSE